MYDLNEIKNMSLKQQAQRRAAAEIATYKQAEHFLSLMYIYSHHPNC